MIRKHMYLRAWLACLLTALLTLLAMGAAAEDALHAMGDELSGFRVTQILHSEQYGLDCMHMEHEKTDAQLIYIV